MKNAQNHDERFAKMTFATVYPHYVAKVEKKGRTKEELHQVITWLTGYSESKLQKLLEKKVTFEQFFTDATMNPNAHLITGVICRVSAVNALLVCSASAILLQHSWPMLL